MINHAQFYQSHAKNTENRIKANNAANNIRIPKWIGDAINAEPDTR